ncbi:MAG: type II toxin-antitoxin system VapC family toxin [Gammaproteobacteria bacterium]|nr:type II toxin-antitoxin system VapC family toxin [Gammaproteobacteria bacterium]
MKMVECIVLDCSVTMAWIFQDETLSEKANIILTTLKEKQIKVPTIWSLEVANVLCLAERQKKITAFEVAEFKEFLSALPIVIDHDTSVRAMGSIYALAKTEQLTVYDAAYLEIAIRENSPLATFDKALKNAAKRNGISIL